MKWLLTTKSNVTLESLKGALERAGADPGSGSDPIPMDNGEQVVEVEGPRDLAKRLERHRSILKVSPSSDLELY